MIACIEIYIFNRKILKENINDKNKVEKYFNYANEKAGELALKAKQISKKNVLIAGSLPSQNDTYVLDLRDKNIIEKVFMIKLNY